MDNLKFENFKGVLHQSTIQKLAMDVHLVLDIERAISTVLSFSFLRKCSIQIEKITRRNIGLSKLFRIKEFTSNKGIIDAIDNQDISMDKAIGSLKQNIETLTKEMKNLVDKTKDNKKLLTAIIEQSNINMDENKGVWSLEHLNCSESSFELL